MRYNPKNHTLIMGCHALEELFERSPNRFLKVFALRVSKKTGGRKLSLISKFQDRGIKVETISLSEMERLCASTSHQGFAAILKKREPVDFKRFLEEEGPSLVLALDSITDPHNVGAILRAAECFGVNLVIWSKNRGAPLTATVAKTSSSASEIVPIHIISNLAQTLDKLIDHGYKVVTADVNQKSKNLFKTPFPKKCVLVLGSEGAGVRPILQKRAHHSFKIPMRGQIDSLNVSQAAALFLGVWSAQFD